MQLPLFPQDPKNCKTKIEEIIYSLTHMESIQKTNINPFSKKEGDFFDRIKTMSHTASLNPQELHAYHQWLKVTNDDRLRLEKAMATGMEEGIAKGIIEEKWQIANNLVSMGLPLSQVAQATGLSVSELQSRFS